MPWLFKRTYFLPLKVFAIADYPNMVRVFLFLITSLPNGLPKESWKRFPLQAKVDSAIPLGQCWANKICLHTAPANLDQCYTQTNSWDYELF